MKFKVGDRVILKKPETFHRQHFERGVVVRSYTDTDFVPVHFDGYDYGPSGKDNAHSGWAEHSFELDVVYYSPLYQALL